MYLDWIEIPGLTSQIKNPILKMDSLVWNIWSASTVIVNMP